MPPTWLFHPTFGNYITIFEQQNFLHPLLNSLFVATVSTGLALCVGSMTAYSLSRWRFRRSRDLELWILSTQMIPPIVVIIPFFTLWSTLGMLNNYTSLIVMYTLSSLPLIIWILLTFFREMPPEVEEAAIVDGCGPFGAFWRIAIPLAAPGLVAAGTFALLQTWNEFLFALVLTGVDTRTVPVVIAQYITPEGTIWGQITATCMMSILPQLLLLFFMQKYLVRGLTAGAVK
jgi:multiple sugar transport system permease protein